MNTYIKTLHGTIAILLVAILSFSLVESKVGKYVAEVSGESQVAAAQGVSTASSNDSTSTPPYTLIVSKDHIARGVGTVFNTSRSINCGPTCSSTSTQFAPYETVFLKAVPEPRSTFFGWSGACTNSGEVCAVTMNQTQRVIAKFDRDLNTYQTLTVTKNGPGLGNIVSSPAGINCGGNTSGTTTCSALFDNASVVTLTAQPMDGSQFDHWEGACSAYSGTEPCIVTMNNARNALGYFYVIPNYSVEIGYSPHGLVTSDPAGIHCPTDCIVTHRRGDRITLTATPDPGFIFSSWGASGGHGDVHCYPFNSNVCTIILNGNEYISASYYVDHGGSPGSVPPQSPTTPSTSSNSYTFIRNLTVGSRGADVTALQTFLIDKGFLAAGKNSGYFGSLTRAALASYQSANGINPATGYFGSVTRGSIK